MQAYRLGQGVNETAGTVDLYYLDEDDLSDEFA